MLSLFLHPRTRIFRFWLPFHHITVTHSLVYNKESLRGWTFDFFFLLPSSTMISVLLFMLKPLVQLHCCSCSCSMCTVVLNLYIHTSLMVLILVLIFHYYLVSFPLSLSNTFVLLVSFSTHALVNQLLLIPIFPVSAARVHSQGPGTCCHYW